ncbi:Testis-expressed sequence 10 protein [Phytophthora cinnamomi]|uniref:Testis-expressed sequence 10 protein n=1 Tax=Phytophthora cinnamomi TaxID=4785 RepID=UPI00355979E6|nr:Testis-expressed sequence 10 protein [Phytophthora cinnamomi]
MGRILERYCMKRQQGETVDKTPACTNDDLRSLVDDLYYDSSSAMEYQDAALLSTMWYAFGRASDLAFVRKSNLSVSSGNVPFIRLTRDKTSEEQDDFNEENRRSCKVSQLKNKFQGLKTTFNNIKASAPQTGNSTEHPLEYPSIWPTLLMYFGDLSGMGNRDFGQTGSITSEVSLSSEEQPRTIVTEGAANKRQARKRKMDLASAVAAMAESLSLRLNSNGTSHDVQPLMTKMARMEEQITALVVNQQKTLQLMQASLDGSRQVNAAILAFMQSTVDNAVTTTIPAGTAQRDKQTGNL